MISQSSLESLKAQIDIVDIVSSYVELRKSGANYKAPCPFHGEKTASFVVSPSKQIYHCFGCGVGGDAIKFVQEYKRLGFDEAVEQIANELNFILQYEQSSHKKDYSNIMEKTNSFYLSNLNKVPTHIGYLHERGLSDESIKEFEIGFSASSKEQVEFINSQLFNSSEAIECGILSRDEKNSIYARLTNRISFPIRNHTGKLIGFGGRITQGEGAKYINSPQTPLFDKSRNFYGYNLAKEHIHKKGTFTVVEGYLDVVMFHQAGIKTAVATMGTALTEQHCILIKKANAKVLLCYDGDKAGMAAALKASKLLSAHEIYGGVVLFPEGKDPADMVKDGNTDELFSLLKSPTPLIKFAINSMAESHNLNIPNQKQDALKEIMEFVQTLSPLLQDEYKPFIAKVLNINSNHIQTQKPVQQANISREHINIAELNIIKSARENNALLDVVLDNLHLKMFDFHAREFEMLLKGDNALDGILLRDELTAYTYEELAHQLKIIQIAYHSKELQNILNSNENFERKAFEMKKVKGIIFQIRRGMV